MNLPCVVDNVHQRVKATDTPIGFGTHDQSHALDAIQSMQRMNIERGQTLGAIIRYFVRLESSAATIHFNCSVYHNDEDEEHECIPYPMAV